MSTSNKLPTWVNQGMNIILYTTLLLLLLFACIVVLGLAGKLTLLILEAIGMYSG